MNKELMHAEKNLASTLAERAMGDSIFFYTHYVTTTSIRHRIAHCSTRIGSPSHKAILKNYQAIIIKSNPLRCEIIGWLPQQISTATVSKNWKSFTYHAQREVVMMMMVMLSAILIDNDDGDDALWS